MSFGKTHWKLKTRNMDNTFSKVYCLGYIARQKECGEWIWKDKKRMTTAIPDVRSHIALSTDPGQ